MAAQFSEKMEISWWASKCSTAQRKYIYQGDNYCDYQPKQLSNGPCEKAKLYNIIWKQTLHPLNIKQPRQRGSLYISMRSKNQYKTGKIHSWIHIIASYTNNTIIWWHFTWSKCLFPTWNIVCNNLVRAGRDADAGTGGGAAGATSLGSKASSWPSNHCQPCCTNCHIICKQWMDIYDYKQWTRKDQGPHSATLVKANMWEWTKKFFKNLLEKMVTKIDFEIQESTVLM